jgi:hypothetical protein
LNENNTMQIYVPLEGSQSNIVQTAWALMGLIHAGQVSSLFIVNLNSRCLVTTHINES